MATSQVKSSKKMMRSWDQTSILALIHGTKVRVKGLEKKPPYFNDEMRPARGYANPEL